MSKQIRLLVVDDDDVDRQLMKESLQNSELDVEFHEARNGALGIVQILALSPTVVVLDTLMPDMDGFTVCKKIKEINKMIKVIICTGVIDAVDAGEARDAGADDYCVKTSNYDSLIGAIRGMCLINPKEET